jgi:hypothetical protein
MRRRIGMSGMESLEDRRMLAITPLLSIPGQAGGFLDLTNPVAPPDVAGDVGPNHFIQAVNHATFGSSVTIYNKSDGSVALGPFAMNSLATSGFCGNGLGDPMVNYDPLADRWILSQFAVGLTPTDNHLCVFVSQTSNPVNNTWFAYDFQTQLFPDYPKMAVWPDGFYISSNERGTLAAPSVYVMDRARMLQGLPARPMQRFVAPPLVGFGFQSLTPADLDGPAPPTGSPNYFMRHVDDELHRPLGADPTQDFLEVWEFFTDFANPANSRFRLSSTVSVGEFESDFAISGGFPAPVTQPGTTVRLDGIPEVIMYRLQYRNFGTHESLVGNYTVDVNGNDLAGIRWFELRKALGTSQWQLQQEGTLNPGDGIHRWLGSIAMNKDGAIAVGYSVGNSALSAGLRASARLASDVPGTMGQGEINLVNGSGFHPIVRWGDYFSMVVDPVDDTTFWFTGQYSNNGNWGTQIIKFEVPPPPVLPPPPPPPARTIYGVVYNDLDGNGRRDLGERGLAGFLVFVDLDNDGRLDFNESAVRSAADGTFTLPPVPAGTYRVRQLPPPSWTQTFPANRAPHVITVDATGVSPPSIEFGNTGGNLLDFGSANGAKQTLLSDNGARHGILPGFQLGATLNGEADASTSDSNDGVVFNPPLFAGGTGSLTATINLGGQSRGLLQAFIDFNHDGDWSDPGEQIIRDLRLGEGTHTVTFPIPAGALTGPANARVRYGWERGIGPDGPALAGEVEDYVVNVFGDVPQANDDTLAVNQDSSLNSLNVLANDFASSAGGLKIQSVTSPSTRGGTVSVSGDMLSVIYTPRQGFFGLDSFNYTVVDASGKTDSARVTVNVVPTFTSPQAVDDQISVAINSRDNPVRVLDNDILGANPPTRIFSIVSGPSNGSARIETNGTPDPADDFIFYTPTNGFSGVDQFRYRILDSVGAASDATVTVFVGDTFSDDIIRYDVKFTDLNGFPINQVIVNNEFVVTVTVADTRSNGTVPDSEKGAFAAFLDVLYSKDLVSLVGALTFNGEYREVPEGNTSVPGIIDEAGAFRNIGELPPGPGDKVLFRARFRANATGVASFIPDPADDVLDPGPPPVLGQHDTLIYFPTSAVPISQITYVTRPLLVITGAAGESAAVHNYAMANDVNGDNRVTPFDALAILGRIRTGGASGEGESAARNYYYDTNNDGRVSTMDILSVVRHLTAKTVTAQTSSGGASGEGEFAEPLAAVLPDALTSQVTVTSTIPMIDQTSQPASRTPATNNEAASSEDPASTDVQPSYRPGGETVVHSLLRERVFARDDVTDSFDSDFFEDVMRGWNGE